MADGDCRKTTLELQSMMPNQGKLSRFLATYQKATTNIYATPSDDGYWSNLSRQQNTELMSMLGTRPTRECIAAIQPSLAEVIFFSQESRCARVTAVEWNGACRRPGLHVGRAHHSPRKAGRLCPWCRSDYGIAQIVGSTGTGRRA